MTDAAALLAPYHELWRMQPDGAAFETASSVLQPVRFEGRPAMLKLIKTEDEEKDPIALQHFAGEGAVRLLACMGWAHVTERASGGFTLDELSEADETAAVHVLCDTLALLHGPRASPPPASLIPLRRRFRALFEMRGRFAVFERAARLAEALLESSRDEVTLHGDPHYGNILWDAARGWLAIDPKGVFGERLYDYAYALLGPPGVCEPGVMTRKAAIISARIGAPLRRLMEFTAAQAALSTAWRIEDGDPDDGLVLADCAFADLDRC